MRSGSRRWLALTLPLIALGAALGGLLSLGTAAEGTGVGRWHPLAPAGSDLVATLLPRRAAALGPGPGGRTDVHLAWVRQSPDGVVLSAWGERNVTRSPAVAETQLIRAESRLAFAAQSSDGHVETIEVVLLADEQSKAGGEDWSLTQTTAALMNSLELWGQPRTPRRIRVDLERPAEAVVLSWAEDRRLRIELDQAELLLSLDDLHLEGDVALARVTEPTTARPDLFRWAVDQLRYSRFVGPDRLQRLEHLYLWADDQWAGLTEDQRVETPETFARHLGRVVQAPEGDPRPWPPAAIAPVLEPPLEGEGEWRERDERFVTQPEGIPPLFLTTFLRTERTRPNSSRVFMTAWDPAWLELDWVAGTVEPRSTVGLNGTGRVPEGDLHRLVAGFNGGFQAVDGAFGMKTRQGPFLPPVPFGATVARLEDGRIGMGSWPDEPVDEDEVVAFRQNLTALLERAEVNPWGRRFWGGVPASLRDTSRTDRTGLCITTQHQMIYFWGKRVTVAGLARAMDAAQCDYGMLLDINFSNTVFETYRVAPRGQLPPLDRPLDPEWEREGQVPAAEELDYRVQAMAPGMTRVGFPRYIRTELRDFFFLTIRPEALTPPGPELCRLEAVDEGNRAPPRAWQCQVTLGEGLTASLVELDTTRVSFELREVADDRPWIAWPVTAASPEQRPALQLRPGRSGGTLVSLLEPGDEADDEAIVLAGIELTAPADRIEPSLGMVASSRADGSLALGQARWPECRGLTQRFRSAGFERVLFLPAGDRQLAASPDDAPMARRIFTGTEPQPARQWAPIHRRAQQHIDELGLTRHYVQIRHYLERDQPQR